MPAIPNFIGSNNTEIAPEVNSELCINLVPQKTDVPNAKAPIVLYGSPGTREFLDFDDGGPIRGQISIENYTFAVSGGNIYAVDPFDDVTGGGTVADDGKSVTMVANNLYVLLVSAGIAYVIGNGVVIPVVDPPWASAIDCAYMNGYFIVLDDEGNSPDKLLGGQFFISALNDPYNWDALDFSTAPASNNKLRGLKVDHNDLWVEGTLVNQPFFFNGQAEFPFLLNETGVMQQGVMSRDAVQNLDNTIIWLGRNKDGLLQAFIAEGYSARRISTDAIETAWSRYADPENVTAWVYQVNGHPTYNLNFITAQKSWRFDNGTKLWHRVAYRNPLNNQDECHRGNNHSVRNGIHIIGDRQSAKLWEFTTEVNADGDDPLVAIRQAPAPWFGNKLVFYKVFWLITPTGIGDGSNLDPDIGTVTPEADPAWMYSWSDDNGHTFGPEYLLQAGPAGAWDLQLRMYGCGSGRNRVHRVSISANVPRCLIGAEQEIEVGTS